jgi:hypothetical protein
VVPRSQQLSLVRRSLDNGLLLFLCLVHPYIHPSTWNTPTPQPTPVIRATASNHLTTNAGTNTLPQGATIYTVIKKKSINKLYCICVVVCSNPWSGSGLWPWLGLRPVVQDHGHGVGGWFHMDVWMDVWTSFKQALGLPCHSALGSFQVPSNPHKLSCFHREIPLGNKGAFTVLHMGPNVVYSGVRST